MSLGLKPTFCTSRVLVKYAVDRDARAAFHAAKRPLTCASGKSAPLFFSTVVAIGVAALTDAALQISKAA